MTTSAIQLKNLSVQFDDRFTLNHIDWQLSPQQHWVITGSNGSGKSALAASLCGYGKIVSGTLNNVPQRTAIVSFEAQAEIIAAELKKDDADILDIISEGTPVHEILQGDTHHLDAEHQKRIDQLVELFKLEYLLDRSFRKLSTGESRKVLLIRALSSQPELLILDEPFDGVDAETLSMLQSYLIELKDQIQMVLVLNRLDEFPDFITHIAYMEKGFLTQKTAKVDIEAYQSLHQMLHLKTSHLTIPPAVTNNSLSALEPTQPLVDLKNITVKYTDTIIIDKLNWRIEPNQHWQLSGPNGSGKTALLSLITGDHPQCYVNDIVVFGFQRGNGESYLANQTIYWLCFYCFTMGIIE